MNKITIWFIIVLAIILVIFASIIIIFYPFLNDNSFDKNSGSSSLISKDVVMFFDDFSDDNLTDWDVSESFSIIKNKDSFSLLSSGLGYAYLPKSLEWNKDYAFKLSYTLNEGTLIFGFNSLQEGRYLLAIDKNIVVLAKEYPANNFIILDTVKSPSLNEIHSVVMGSYDNHIQVFFDRQLYIHFVDDSPVKGGAVSIISADNSRFNIHAVLVNEFVNFQESIVTISEPSNQELKTNIKNLCAEFKLSSLPDTVLSIPDFQQNNNIEGLMQNSSNNNPNKSLWMILIIIMGVIIICLVLSYILVLKKLKKSLLISSTSNLNVDKLSEREKDVLDLMLKGYSMSQIASSLYISISTAKGHGNKIYKKLGIHSRHELILKFMDSQNNK
jgi:DNA-binding CsgD family transcriptional regulator